ncbi:MAG: hypothetical protein KF901_27680 [Myxococcales bacterium]|nr:hypothetical protein [Myxococcales bacterium]
MNTRRDFSTWLSVLVLVVASSGTTLAQVDDDVPQPEAPTTVEPAPTPPPTAQPTRETVCDDGIDNDGDGLTDCADADCFDTPVCEVHGPERNDERCSDWIDNDGDGLIDCDDSDCQADPVTVCRGSAQDFQSRQVQADDTARDLPRLTGDMTAEDLIGNFGDNHGERDDYTCSDGIDNDGDGRIDCQDFGCRFDPQVTVCNQSPGYRFGVVAGVGFSYDFQENRSIRTAADVNFTRLQLRALGPIPYLDNSFFLLNFRAERSFRMTFAHFQVPLGKSGHFVAINSGSGTLSNQLIISVAKQPLLDPAFYLVNAFEQGNGAVAEVGGPLVASNRVAFRVFAGGGAGFSTGNVGGRFFRNENENFTWVAGAQFQFNVIGHFSRFDSPLMYTPMPLGLGFWAGAKYDQRATERYPAGNASLWFRTGWISLRAETYAKYVLDFGGSFQMAWNAQLSVLLWPKRLFFAADVGQFTAQEYSALPAEFDQRPTIIRDELRIRAALHFWWFRNIGLLTLMFDEGRLQDDGRFDTNDRIRRVRLEAQYRF